MVTIDELDASTREFFDKLKVLMMSGPNKRDTKLSSLDIQKALGLSKSHTNRFLSTLVDHEYVKKEGQRNQGFTYTVTHWDELNSIKQMIQGKLVNHRDPNGMGRQNPHKH
jgi:predicted transcriptional regulator